MKIINVLKNLIKNNMTYSEYAEQFLGITKEEFDEVIIMFPNLNKNLFKEMFDKQLFYIDSNKEDLIINIIYTAVDPEGDYIDDLEICNKKILKVHERLDVENIGKWRLKLSDLLSNSNFIIEFE